MSNDAVIGLKSTWDELFGGGSTSADLSVLQRAPADDRADSWLDSAPAVTRNHHAVVDPFDSTTMFDDAFLDGIVGISRGDGAAQQADDVWNTSATTGQLDPWPTNATDTSRSPFGDFADRSALPRTVTGADEYARPRPRPQAQTAAGFSGVNADNPFTATLQAATAAARSAVEMLVTLLLCYRVAQNSTPLPSHQ